MTAHITNPWSGKRILITGVCGTETTILDLAHRIQAAFPDRRIEIVHEGQRAGEIIRNYSSIAKAQAVLGWSPQVTLDEGLAHTVASFRIPYQEHQS